MPAVYSTQGLTAARQPVQHRVFRVHRLHYRTRSDYTWAHDEPGGLSGPKKAIAVLNSRAWRMITDGTSNTILAVEAKRNIPWTKPEDIPFDPDAPLPELGGFWPKGFHVVFADGAARFLKESINPAMLKALITRAGGEVISSDSY